MFPKDNNFTAKTRTIVQKSNDFLYLGLMGKWSNMIPSKWSSATNMSLEFTGLNLNNWKQ